MIQKNRYDLRDFKRMKIGILGTRGVPNNYGGFEQFAEYFALSLVGKGIDVFVYCSHNHIYNQDNWKGVNLIHCLDPEYKYGAAGQFIYDLNCICDSRKRNFDIILQLGYTSSSVWGWLQPKEAISVCNVDGMEWQRRKYNVLAQLFLRFAEWLVPRFNDYLIADSIPIQNYFTLKYKKNITYIPYGAEIPDSISPDTPAKYGLMYNEYDLLIARIQPDNNIQTIIEGAVNAENKRPLVIVGDYKHRFGYYLQFICENKAVIFLGAIYNIQILNSLRYYSNVYFHGHSAGGTNPSLLEAMASSALIAAHDNPFNRAVLKENGFYFSTDKDVTEILNSKVATAMRKQFIENNLQQIETEYNWQKVNDAYYELFLKAISENQQVPTDFQ